MSKYQEAQQLMKKVWEHEYHNHKKANEYVTNLTFQEILNMQARLQKIQTIREKMSDPTIYKQQYYKYMKSSTGRLSATPTSDNRSTLKSDSKILFDKQRQDNENKQLEKSMKITTSQVSQGPPHELARTNTERSFSNPISQISMRERHQHLQDVQKMSFMTFDKLFADDQSSRRNNLLSQIEQTRLTNEFLDATDPMVPSEDVSSVMQRRDKFLKPKRPKTQQEPGPIYVNETPQSRTQSQNTLREEIMQDRFIRNSCMVKHLRLASVQYIKQKRTNSATPLNNFISSQLVGREAAEKNKKRPPITQIEANLERLKKFGRGAPK